jgi:hypothetical protein
MALPIWPHSFTSTHIPNQLSFRICKIYQLHYFFRYFMLGIFEFDHVIVTSSTSTRSRVSCSSAMIPRTARRAAALCSNSFRPLSTKSSPRYAFPTIPTCPSPSCACRPMPQDLDIDYKRSLDGMMAPYAVHVLVATGVSNWLSRIEDDKRYTFAKDSREQLKVGRKFYNVCSIHRRDKFISMSDLGM